MARVGSALVCAAALVQSAGAFTTPSVSRRGPVSYRSSLRSSVVTATKESLVTPITSMEQFLAEKKKADEVGSPIMVVKFYASWCRACKSIAPRFKKVAMEYNDNIACYEIEFVANQELCKELGIKKLPCMHFCTLSARARARAGPWRSTHARARDPPRVRPRPSDAGELGKVEDFVCGPSKFAQVHELLAPYLKCDPRSEEPCQLTDLFDENDEPLPEFSDANYDEPIP